jgi:hypothetical protein
LKDMNNSKTTDDDKAKPKAPVAEPFYYNGQIMYPVGAFSAPMGNPMVPFHVVGIPHGVAPHLPGHYVQQQPAQTSLTTTGPSHTPSTHSLSGIPPVVNHIVPANANFNAASAPPISSIRPSDITRKQIASFKQNLKYHVDQLQYNRHQIDEKEMEKRIQTIQGHIQKFETTLKTQLEYEAVHFKTNQEREDMKPSQPITAPEEHSSAVPALMPLEYRAPVTKQEMDEAVNRRVTLSTYGLNTSIGEGGKVMFRSPAEQAFSNSNTNGLPNGASLPSDAALAPIFQPRGYASTWTGSKYAREMKAYEEAEKRLVAESKSLEHMRLGDQRSVSQPFAAPMAPAAQTQRTHNDSDNSGRSGSGGTKLSNFGVPYLLGTLPKGVNPRTARDQDYVYKRPLTEEERRARFLYWGKAPKSAVMGLPKFDGKHFYPPSPIKERSTEPARESGSRMADLDCDPFRPLTPVQGVDSKGVSASEDNCTAGRLTRSISFETQVNSGSEDCILGGAPLGYREESMDSNSVDPADRRSEIPG